MKIRLIILCLLGHALYAQTVSRFTHIQKFFGKRPAGLYSREFLEAAEKYDLDWRLLPALAMAESGGGLHCHANNLFGWQSGRAQFDDVPEAIDIVARGLNGRRYHGRTLQNKLRIYNPTRREYPGLVRNWMSKLQRS